MGDRHSDLGSDELGEVLEGAEAVTDGQYLDFIASKAVSTEVKGFEPIALPLCMKHHQRVAVDFAIRRGRSALFLDTGLGKTLCQLSFAHAVVRETGRPVLILAPLAVGNQFVSEGVKFDLPCTQVRDQSGVADTGVYVTNYERLSKFDASAFSGAVLDESSILKSFGGSTKMALIDAFRDTPYKLCATATPAPNDFTELGSHAEFLGVMGQMEMLCRWFINDTSEASQSWRLKGHAEREFWDWVASWSRCATMPSDLGGSDKGYILPEIEQVVHKVERDITQDVADGMLFAIPELSATSFHKEKRLTLDARCRLASDLANTGEPVTVWCETNDESALLAKLVDGAVELKGSDTAAAKERKLIGFANGDYRAIVTKPKIAGFGVNWQHCAHAVFASISFSYEQHYQAVRRSHRFGQSRQVRNDIVISDTEAAVWSAVNRKSADHDRMKAAMSRAMREAQSVSLNRAYTTRPDFVFPPFIQSQTGGRHAA